MRGLLLAGVAGLHAADLACRQADQGADEFFHAPSQTGVFGSAIAASRIMKHDPHRTTMAIGIGESLCSGLLAFAKARNGGMVKRLHMGRAAKGGVTAACAPLRPAGRDQDRRREFGEGTVASRRARTAGCRHGSPPLCPSLQVGEGRDGAGRPPRRSKRH